MLGVSHVCLLKFGICSRGIIVFFFVFFFLFFFPVSLTTVTNPHLITQRISSYRSYITVVYRYF